MTDFSEYEKMPDRVAKMRLSDTDFTEMEKLKWVVTEKVHGANFSFTLENGKMRYAKRKAYLSWNDDFFGFQLVVNRLESNILRLFESLSLNIKGNKYIIYGELFGGKYPHPDVKAVEGLQAIQTGVYYAPDIRFCAFDIAIDNEEGKHYLDYELAVSYFEQFGVFYAKPLLVGKFQDALNFNIRISSTIPKLLNLPEIKDNLIEGIVIKPFSKSADTTLAIRPIVKVKNPEFEEEDKFHEAKKWTYIPNVSSKAEELSFIIDELKRYITYNRFESVTSKVGTLQHNNQQRVAEIETEFLNDVITDFNENNGHILSDMLDVDKGWIKDRALHEIRKVISESLNGL